MSQLGISTMSLGRCWAGHSFEHKLDMAAKHGYRGIELWHEDLMDIAARYPGGLAVFDNQLTAARYVRRLCAARRLSIICLQPFAMFEGAVDRAVHAARLADLRLWLRLAHALGTDLIHIASSMAPAAQLSPDTDLAVADLQAAARLAAAQSPPVRLSYEALAWGSRIDTWEQSWAVVQAVDMANFGLCLDSFNIAGRIYADPASATGCTPDAAAAVTQSMQRLVAQVDVARVFFVQVVDAARLAAPLVPGHEYYNAEQPSRMSWSRNCRLFYGEHERGAYLPVTQICEAFFNGLGFRGWVSLELFNKRMSETDAEVPEELARRGAVCWEKLIRDMGMDVAKVETEADAEGDSKAEAKDKEETIASALPAQHKTALAMLKSVFTPKMLPTSIYLMASSAALFVGMFLV
ncbi:hypothetical protein TD95_001500 [Thielaviopsis punctulata]|uniref:Xylose isomerase-like TIM barrel domain-containing protein n=1 Tax=Thielaviopsis punctulata TaxID=72032 RepID=A0A0F4ZH41_9PEZI|nr:hypothetical protein TD95_001500 [Thielaviopsis punctulata]